MEELAKKFDPQTLKEILPPERTDEFFEALYGDVNEGVYDIRLAFHGANDSTLDFSLDLHERPGKCLACHLTYGLPEVFSRHPVINVAGIVKEIEARLEGKKCRDWQLGATSPVDRKLYRIPLRITLED